MLAKVYAPTIAQRRLGLEVAGRFWTKWLFIRTGIYIAVPLAFGWYEADFMFPIPLDTGTLIVGLVAAILTEIAVHSSRRDQAKSDAKWEAQSAEQYGPMLYRLSDAGLELMQGGHQTHYGWEAFSRFKLTDDTLVLVHPGSGSAHWVFSRSDIGEDRLSAVLENLERSGATRL